MTQPTIEDLEEIYGLRPAPDPTVTTPSSDPPTVKKLLYNCEEFISLDRDIKKAEAEFQRAVGPMFPLREDHREAFVICMSNISHGELAALSEDKWDTIVKTACTVFQSSWPSKLVERVLSVLGRVRLETIVEKNDHWVVREDLQNRTMVMTEKAWRNFLANPKLTI